MEGFTILSYGHQYPKHLYKQANKMHFSYAFFLQFLVQLYMFQTIISFIIRRTAVYCIYSSVQTVQTCLTAWSLQDQAVRHVRVVCTELQVQ